MKPLLIIPDLHLQHQKAEEIIARYPEAKVLFLGDYFDAYEDDVNEHRQMARWLAHSSQNPKRIHLLGNHDLYYFTGKACCQVPGNTAQKFRGSQEFLTPATWRRMQFYHWITPNFLASHAGLTRSFAHPIRALTEYLEQQASEARHACEHNLDHAWLRWGQRGGYMEASGPLWCDWTDFQTLPGIHQVFGHTPRYPHPQWKKEENTVSIMLDANSGYPGGYALFNQGCITIHTPAGNIQATHSLG